MIWLDVKAIKEEKGGQEHYDLRVELPQLDGDDGRISFTRPSDINIDFTNTGFCILLTGNISVPVRMICARCLAPFDYTIQTEFFETYYDKEKGLPKNAGDSEDFIPYTGNSINIEPEVMKAILLAMPLRALCHPECKGLCPQCGTDLNTGVCSCRQENVDPRMAKLKELLEK